MNVELSSTMKFKLTVIISNMYVIEKPCVICESKGVCVSNYVYVCTFLYVCMCSSVQVI